ncbi:MAG: hypothetical protein IJK38_13065 [Oscillospiraceae bacterium]|nr:hypothetical protein [Oscillospiraceae bacterium]
MSSENGLQRMTRESNLALWAEQVRSCKSSGLTVNEWCATNGIRPNLYYQHQKKVFLAMRAKEGQFYEVPAVGLTGRIAASIQINGLSADIHSGADECTVLAILRAMKSC